MTVPHTHTYTRKRGPTQSYRCHQGYSELFAPCHCGCDAVPFQVPLPVSASTGSAVQSVRLAGSGWITGFPLPHRVAQYAEENKMGSPNLALVFGPTLTRAPDDKDPRQLHNDVPSINVLIQLCIDYHEYIFGEEDEEEAAREGSLSPQQHTESPLLEKLEDAVLQEPRESPTPPPLSSTPQV